MNPNNDRQLRPRPRDGWRCKDIEVQTFEFRHGNRCCWFRPFVKMLPALAAKIPRLWAARSIRCRIDYSIVDKVFHIHSFGVAEPLWDLGIADAQVVGNSLRRQKTAKDGATHFAFAQSRLAHCIHRREELALRSNEMINDDMIECFGGTVLKIVGAPTFAYLKFRFYCQLRTRQRSLALGIILFNHLC